MKTRRFRALLACAAMVAAHVTDPVIAAEPLIGEYSGDSTNASFGADGVRLDLDCARAEIRRGVRVGADGRFEATGLYVDEHVGPIDGEAAARAVEATFEGRLRGDRIDLTISIAGRGDAEQLTLKRGHRVKRVRCLSSEQEVRGKPRLARPMPAAGRRTYAATGNLELSSSWARNPAA
jgi:hypothetical protein